MTNLFEHKTFSKFTIKDIVIETQFNECESNENELILKVLKPNGVKVILEIESESRNLLQSNIELQKDKQILNFADEVERTDNPNQLQYCHHIRPTDLKNPQIYNQLAQLLEEYFVHTKHNSYRPSKRGFCEVFCRRKKNIIIRYASMRLDTTFQELWQNYVILKKNKVNNNLCKKNR